MDLRLFHFGMETWKCQRARSFLMLLSIQKGNIDIKLINKKSASSNFINKINLNLWFPILRFLSKNFQLLSFFYHCNIFIPFALSSLHFQNEKVYKWKMRALDIIYNSFCNLLPINLHYLVLQLCYQNITNKVFLSSFRTSSSKITHFSLNTK